MLSVWCWELAQVGIFLVTEGSGLQMSWVFSCSLSFRISFSKLKELKNEHDLLIVLDVFVEFEITVIWHIVSWAGLKVLLKHPDLARSLVEWVANLINQISQIVQLPIYALASVNLSCCRSLFYLRLPRFLGTCPSFGSSWRLIHHLNSLLWWLFLSSSLQNMCLTCTSSGHNSGGILSSELRVRRSRSRQVHAWMLVALA